MNFESQCYKAYFAEFIFFSESIISFCKKENFYPEKLKNEGSPRWASKKNRKGKNDRFRNYNKHVNSQEAS